MCKMTLDIKTEIRKMPPSNTRELVQILEYNESWKRLMAIIPKKLDSDDYKAELKIDNLPKYNSEHFRLIENAADKLHRACAEILLDEWGTSGRIRPALGHLLFLLKKAELFRAADFIAVTLLNMETPERPKEGPAAPVTVNFVDTEEIQEVLNGINYHSADLEGNTMENNLDREVEVKKESKKTVLNENKGDLVIPKIVVTEITEGFKVPLVVPRSEVIPVVVEEVGEEVSDLIKFSTGEISRNLPDLSALNLHSDSTNNSNSTIDTSNDNSTTSIESSDNNLPAVLDSSTTNLPAVLDSSSTNLPAVLVSSAMNLPAVLQSSSMNLPAVLENSSANIPAVLDSSAVNLPAVLESSSGNIPVVLESSAGNIPAVLESSSANIPAVLDSSAKDLQADQNLDSCSESNLPAFSQIMSNLIPHISKLLHSETSNEIPSSSSPVVINDSTNSRPTCSSPLPNLSLNTLLPHFSYCELEVATNNFDETPHKNSLEMENSLDESNGRFLGAGAFGSVYLAMGLLEKPIAVKKLYLNAEEVNVDDVITKQFRNEVEVLSKYKHENLLSICGYSCDGPTYCLLYDYISGGALNCRLEKYKERLQWKERLRIGLGTAEAVSYLHTAFATPLIHRDIKTANILLDCSNTPKLGDFGIIKLSPNQNTTISTTIIGTSVYMAPEAFRSGDVSVKTDSFSFGVVILELLTALPPLDETRESIDLISHVEEICEDQIEPLLDRSAGSWQENGRNIGEELFQVANKCLEEKKKRPNMVEVREMLKTLLHN